MELKDKIQILLDVIATVDHNSVLVKYCEDQLLPLLTEMLGTEIIDIVREEDTMTSDEMAEMFAPVLPKDFNFETAMEAIKMDPEVKMTRRAWGNAEMFTYITRSEDGKIDLIIEPKDESVFLIGINKVTFQPDSNDRAANDWYICKR